MAELTLTPADPAGAASAPAKPLMKGRQTRAAILDAALKLASHMGLEGLSIGALAAITEMSKSGVFAHFGSREELQISVVREYHARFEEEVFVPRCASRAAAAPARCSRWVRRVSAEIDSGRIYISGAVEFDDRPGPSATRSDDGPHPATAPHRAIRGDDRVICARHRSRTSAVRAARANLALHHDARFLRNCRRRTCPRRVRTPDRPARDARRQWARCARRQPARPDHVPHPRPRLEPVSETQSMPTTPRRCVTCSSSSTRSSMSSTS